MGEFLGSTPLLLSACTTTSGAMRSTTTKSTINYATTLCLVVGLVACNLSAAYPGSADQIVPEDDFVTELVEATSKKSLSDIYPEDNTLNLKQEEASVSPPGMPKAERKAEIKKATELPPCTA